jgi:hypothetical protein
MIDSSNQIIKKYSPCKESPIPLPVWLSFKVVGGIEPTNEVFPADTGTKIFDDGVCPPYNPIFGCEGRKMIESIAKIIANLLFHSPSATH